MKQKQVNGANQLSPAQEAMRQEVVDLELKARYWKAQFEIRHYTLESERIQQPYNEYLEEQRKKNEELQKEFEKHMEELQKKAEIEVHPIEKPAKVYDESDTGAMAE